MFIASRLARSRLQFRYAVTCFASAATPQLRYFSTITSSLAMEDSVGGASPRSIHDLPSAGQTVLVDGEKLTTIKEGLAHILVPSGLPISLDTKAAQKGDATVQQVFYNPIQQFNRDLSVLGIKAFGEDVVARRALQKEKSRSRTRRRPGKRQRHNEFTMEGTEKRRKTEDNAVDDLEPSTSQGVGATDQKQEGLPNGHGPDADVGAETDTQEGLVAEASTPETTQPAKKPDLHGTEVESDRPPDSSYKIRILDALSATGLRALRYASELPFPTSVVANDLSSKATKQIKANVVHNRLSSSIEITTGNALVQMYTLVGQEGQGGPGRKFDVIDLDPYGSAAPFLDAAVQAIADGGMLALTCTDSAIWASNGYPEKTYSLYGGLPIRSSHSHEGGLRLILQAVAQSASRYGLAIEPLLSLSIDFYARVFVRIHRSPSEVKFLAGNTMLVYTCDSGCGSWTTQPMGRNIALKNKKGNINWKHALPQGPTADVKCAHCGWKTHLSGPMWGGPMHNPAFVRRLLSYLPELSPSTYGTLARLEGVLTTALEEDLNAPLRTGTIAPEATSATTSPALIPRSKPELSDPHPFYVLPSQLARILRTMAPSDSALRGALRGLGYRASRSHAKAGSIKTDAPWSALWEVMREWVAQKSPVKDGKLNKGSSGYTILGLDNLENQRKYLRRAQEGEEEGVEDEAKGNSESKSEGEGATETQGPERKMYAVEERTESTSIVGEEDGQGDASAVKKPRKISFDEALGRRGDNINDSSSKANDQKKRKKVARYPVNPRENWGPMARAK